MCANSCTRRLFLLVRESVEQIPAAWSPQPRAKIARGSPVLEVNRCGGTEASRSWVKEAWLRSKIASRIALGELALAMAWVGFQQAFTAIPEYFGRWLKTNPACRERCHMPAPEESMRASSRSWLVQGAIKTCRGRVS